MTSKLAHKPLEEATRDELLAYLCGRQEFAECVRPEKKFEEMDRDELLKYVREIPEIISENQESTVSADKNSVKQGWLQGLMKKVPLQWRKIALTTGILLLACPLLLLTAKNVFVNAEGGETADQPVTDNQMTPEKVREIFQEVLKDKSLKLGAKEQEHLITLAVERVQKDLANHDSNLAEATRAKSWKEWQIDFARRTRELAEGIRDDRFIGPSEVPKPREEPLASSQGVSAESTTDPLSQELVQQTAPAPNEPTPATPGIGVGKPQVAPAPSEPVAAPPVEPVLTEPAVVPLTPKREVKPLGQMTEAEKIEYLSRDPALLHYYKEKFEEGLSLLGIPRESWERILKKSSEGYNQMVNERMNKGGVGSNQPAPKSN